MKGDFSRIRFEPGKHYTDVLKQQGRTVDEAIQTITDELKSRYPNTNRISGAVKVAYQETP